MERRNRCDARQTFASNNDAHVALMRSVSEI